MIYCEACLRREVRRQATVHALTNYGPWAYLCEEHYGDYGIGLGPESGQRLDQ